MTDLVPDLSPDSADHWLAYRYLTGELSDDEAAACEARLCDDLGLQVALAECVELTTRLSRLPQHPGVKPASVAVAGRDTRYRSLRRSPAGAAAAVGLLAAGLLFTSALVAPRQAGWHDGAGSHSQVLDPSSVVAMWSELGDENDLADRDEKALRFESFDEDDLEIPEWMLVAVLEEPEEGEDVETPQEHQL